jgi:hypothetical protein
MDALGRVDLMVFFKWVKDTSSMMIEHRKGGNPVPTKSIVGQITRRDLWIAAAELDMRDASEQDVAKVCFLISACDMTRDQAKAKVNALKRTADTSNAKKLLGLVVPEEWLPEVKEDLATLTPSQLVRYVLAYAVDESHDDAMQLAIVKRGRKPRA